MNFYNPYYYSPYALPVNTSRGLFSSLFGRGISFSSILNGTQKTLNIVNQAIPVVKQVTPMIKNAKTMFKVMNEFKKVDEPVSVSNTNKIEEIKSVDNNMPTFFQ